MHVLTNVVRPLMNDRMDRRVLVGRVLLDQGVLAEHPNSAVERQGALCNILEPRRKIIYGEWLPLSRVGARENVVLDLGVVEEAE